MSSDKDPVTKADLKEAIEELAVIFKTALDTTVGAAKDELKDYVQDEITASKEEITTVKQEIINHFDVVAENIHLDVAGANHDEISLIKNKQENHEERINRIEQRVGAVS